MNTKLRPQEEFAVASITAKELGLTPESVWCATPAKNQEACSYSLPKNIKIGTRDTDETGAKLTPNPFSIVISGGGKQTFVCVKAEAGWHRWNFVDFATNNDGVEVRVDLEGHTSVDDAIEHIEVAIIQGCDDESRWELFSRGWRELYPAAFSQRNRSMQDWWSKPIYCGWGDQSAMSLAVEGPCSQMRAMAYCTQELYERWIARLEQAEVPIGTIIVDAGWSLSAGVWKPEPARWPNMRDFIDRQHAKGYKVLLWIATWFTDGLLDEWCVFVDGQKLTANPLHPEYRKFLRKQVHHIISPDGLDADGFKIDQLAYTPTERRPRYGVHFGTSGFIDGPHSRIDYSDELWGCELLYLLQRDIYEAAKKAKPDSLVTSSTVHPYFHDTLDMVRLHDSKPNGVFAAMKGRADLSRAVLPHKPIDTDNWILANYEQWKKYTMTSRDIGVPCLFYSENFVCSFTEEPTVLPISLQDLNEIGQAWR